MKEVNELNKDTKYEIPLFDLFPIIVAILYKVNICIYQVDIINDYTDCVFREPQIYKSFNNEEEGSELLKIIFMIYIFFYVFLIIVFIQKTI